MRRWTLRDREGVRHIALIPNDEEATWTPIACGDGIVLPGPQTKDPATCPECIRRRRAVASGEKQEPEEAS